MEKKIVPLVLCDWLTQMFRSLLEKDIREMSIFTA